MNWEYVLDMSVVFTSGLLIGAFGWLGLIMAVSCWVCAALAWSMVVHPRGRSRG